MEVEGFPPELNQLADLLPEGIMLVGADGIIKFVNECGHGLLGLSADQVIGKTLFSLVRDDEETVRALLRSGSRNRHLLPGHLDFVAASGDVLGFRCEVAVYRPASKLGHAIILLRFSRKHVAVKQFLSLNERIAELDRQIQRRAQAETALQSYSRWLSVTLGSIGDAVIATEADGRVTYMNAVAEQMTGWTLADAQGLPLENVFVIINEHTRGGVESPVTKVLREGCVVGLANHTLLVRKDGSEHPIDDSGAPIRDHSGKLIGVVLVFHDISERHRMERELQRQAEQLLEADRRKDRFLSMLAHELRNPLAPMAIGVELLQRLPGTMPEVHKVGQMMQRQVAHLSRLVADLLDVSRITNGHIDLHREKVPINDVLLAAVEMVRPLIDQRQHRLTITLAPPALTLYVDRARLVQVFSNLLSNAAKFTPTGGAISICAALHASNLLVTVSDTGIGIEEQMLPRVFDLFMQADRSLDRTQGGLGVGLTVVHTLVEMHGGEVLVRSGGAGRGSEFVVSLPTRTEGHEPVVAAADPSGSAAEISVPGVRQPKRVLLVDDNKDAAHAMTSLLGLWGHDVRVAYDGPEALEVAASFHPEVVFLDIGLPHMDGYEVARRLRAEPNNGNEVLLVALTGYGQEDDIRRALDAGFDHHFTKPVDLACVAELLGDPRT